MRPTFKVPIKFALIAGVLGAVLVIGLYFVGKQHPFLVPFFLDFRMFLFGIFIYFQLKEIRDFHQKGELYFSQAMLSSFVFIFIYAVLASAIIIGFGYLQPEFVTSFIAQFKEQVSTWSAEDVQRVGKENIDRNLEALSATNAFWMGYNYFKQCFWIGAIVSIILSVILKRQPKT